VSEPTAAQQEYAPGWPGIRPRWTSSAKQGVGTSLSPASQVWFTLSHGIINEVYYPRLDQACIRDMGILVTDGKDFFSEEKRHTHHALEPLSEGVPACRLENTCTQGRYRIEKQVVTDPLREALLQHTRFVPLQGEGYRLFVLLAPHIGNRGSGNTAWLGDYKGRPMLFAERQGICLALACSAPWLKRSVGFVGFSDAWQDISRHHAMTWSYRCAENGNLAMAGEVDLGSCGGEFVVVLGFGRNSAEAGNRAQASLSDGFAAAQSRYIEEWRQWLQGLPQPEPKADRGLYRASAAVLRVHEAKNFAGGMIASLSIPWGFAKGDDDLGGYHLVWPRDLVETAGGLLAVGANESARRVVHYLQSTQEADGHWPQNMWLDGSPYWTGIQMDETAFPILLVGLGLREKAFDGREAGRLWPMVRRAAAFLVQNGPVTQQDRWEEDPGYSPFTLAVEVAALLEAARLAEDSGEPQVASYLRDTADTWNEGIERWTYVSGTALARKVGVDGYYVRVAPPETSEAASPAGGFVPIKNRPPWGSQAPVENVVSPDALALVRFGLRSPDDPRIRDTVRVLDALLKVETPLGPAWHRYNDDGYGENADGSAFDGTGIGRAWPLITGERAHYELAAGNRAEAQRLCATLEAFAGEGNLLPEQVWDAQDIPERELYCGRPSGSAMPLLWAHAEYVKLRRSLRDGRVFDTPLEALERYVKAGRRSPWGVWRFNHKCHTLPAGKTLRVELLAPAVVRWSADGWAHSQEVPTRPTGLGVHLADLPTSDLRAPTQVLFTFRWQEKGWEGKDHSVRITEASAADASAADASA
jgi:glucoamylase